MRLATLIRGVACAVVLMMPGPVLAQNLPLSVASTPVLTIDQNRLFNDSAFGKAATMRRSIEEEALAAENIKIEAALEVEERDLTGQRATMSADAFRTLADAFDVKVEGIRTAQLAKKTSIASAYEEDRRRFFVDIAAPLIAETMRDMGAVAVLDKQYIILSLQSIDVTARVVARIDATVGDGTGTAPPPGPAVQP
jgi:Skp family chaperone for outer membrane proteins